MIIMREIGEDDCMIVMSEIDEDARRVLQAKRLG
jgi:hypothetical protein